MNIIPRFLTAAWALVACLPWVAQGQTTPSTPPATASLNSPSKAQSVRSVEGIAEYRLSNGMQVLLAPDDSKPTTTVNVTYRVGSKHENYGETGMAHLLEHLIFKGTPTHRNVWAEFTKRGLRANGTTWTDRTNYFASFAASDDALHWYLNWQADAMVNSFIARADLDSEMSVVRNEMEMGENNPDLVIWEATMAAMYRWHNYGKSTIGARSDVENVDIARLQAFYRQYYQPDNATLIIAGKFDVAQTMALVERSFGVIPRPTRTLPRLYTIDPTQTGEQTVTVRRAGGSPLVMAAWHVPPGAHPDFAAASLLTTILAEEGTGRLHRSLVQQKLAANVQGYAFGFADPSMLFVQASLAPGQDLAKAREQLLATVDGLRSQPITQAELDRARTKWLNAWARGFNDPERIGVDLSEAVALGDWRLYFLQRDQVRRLVLADVQRVANERLRRDNRTVSIYLPESQFERAPAPAFADVAAIVGDYKGDANAALAEAFEATPANIDRRTQTRQLASGMRVALLPKGTRGGVVNALIRLRLGDATSLQNQATVAALLSASFDHGGAGLTREQFKDQLDQWRTELGFNFADQTLSITIQTVRAHLPAVLRLVTQVLRNPALPEAAVDETRAQWLAFIERQRQDPEALVNHWMSRHGNDHPRGHPLYVPSLDERVQDLQAVTVARAKALHQSLLSAADGDFAAVGDMDVPAVQQALDESLGAWSKPAVGGARYQRIAKPLVPLKVERFVVRTPDKQNAGLVAALRMPINEQHADYPALTLGLAVLGRGGSSRLWKRVRETEGLSYDVRAGGQWSSYEANSTFVMSAIFAPQNQAKVEVAVREEVARIVKDGVSAAELDEARQGLLQARRLGRAQDLSLVQGLARNLDLQRGYAFEQGIDEALGKVTAAQVNAALRQYLDPTQLAYAWGGDFK